MVAMIMKGVMIGMMIGKMIGMMIGMVIGMMIFACPLGRAHEVHELRGFRLVIVDHTLLLQVRNSDCESSLVLLP